jgi:hypothetical protein
MYDWSNAFNFNHSNNKHFSGNKLITINFPVKYSLWLAKHVVSDQACLTKLPACSSQNKCFVDSEGVQIKYCSDIIKTKYKPVHW